MEADRTRQVSALGLLRYETFANECQMKRPCLHHGLFQTIEKRLRHQIAPLFLWRSFPEDPVVQRLMSLVTIPRCPNPQVARRPSWRLSRRPSWRIPHVVDRAAPTSTLAKAHRVANTRTIIHMLRLTSQTMLYQYSRVGRRLLALAVCRRTYLLPINKITHPSDNGYHPTMQGISTRSLTLPA